MRFLLRTGAVPLTTVMRRVLTGYAGTCNRRHHRYGYLCQNRYKSILCQDEPYLLELVRYLGERECVAAALAAGGEGLGRRQRLRSHGYDFGWLLRRVAAVAGLPPADLVTPSLA